MARGTQTKLAKATGINNGWISKILRGLVRPSWPVAERLAAATDTTPEFWMKATPEEKQAALAKMAG